MNETALKAVPPFEITGAVIDKMAQLNLLFNNTKDAEEFAKVLASFKRVGDIDLGNQHFKIVLFREEPKVILRGNLHNAIAFIQECGLVSKGSLEKYINEVSVKQIIEDSKSVLLEQKKLGEKKLPSKDLIPYELFRTSVTDKNVLNLYFRNSDDAEGFFDVFHALKRSVDLGQSFDVSFFGADARVSLSGNPSNAVSLIKEYGVIGRESMAAHIDEAQLKQITEKNKSVVHAQQKVEKQWQQESSPEKLIATFSIAVSPPTEKKSASCFCVRRNKK
jgi:hypothetical protein